MRHVLLVAVALLGIGVDHSEGADWTDAVFPVRSHDFGTVARGSKVRHSFKLINSTQQSIHISSWKAKCGCTDVRVGARDVPPGTQTVIEAVIDTTKFTGFKPSGLTLFLDRPTPAQVDLNLTCFIRSDLTLTPGQVDFGVVNRSTGPKVDLMLTYSGAQPDWAVQKMGTISDHIVAELRESGRSAGGQVSYQLTASLKPSAPVGYFKDEITLLTNDPNSPKVPVSVSAVVQSNVIVSPTVINLGNVKPGQTIQRTVLVRSGQPFKLNAIRPGRPELSALPPNDQAQPMHSVNLTFKAPATPGPFNSPVEFETDLKDEPPARVMTFATVVP
ncbi:DUF1573 domain-containing protein [Tundrisphaera lichenicola]|uniref:DUF1573 domain-containing protein n=1 Tax=Tundrisphaera lichenicola TaxID=2029860 RepID=UPI003EB94CA1